MDFKWIVVAAIVLCVVGVAAQGARPPAADVRLMTLDPGHFHAALIQKEMYPGVDAHVDVYASDGPDLAEHLKRVQAFNTRAERPTSWQTRLHTGPDFLTRLLTERPGNVVVLSGRNRGKIGRLSAMVGGGLHVLGDKPWILEAADLPALAQVLADAEAKQVVAYDIMTERFEVTNRLQRALVHDRAIVGEIERGTPENPGVYVESVHYLLKVVAGAPNIRPQWFFDTSEQGEGLNDIGTHLVDLVAWTLFPEQSLDYRRDITVHAAQRWPTWITEADFRRVTNAAAFPEFLASRITDGKLEYYANTLVSYALRGVHTTLNVMWDWEAAPGSGDTHYAVYRGSESRVEIRQTAADKFLPELYVVPTAPARRAHVLNAVLARVKALQREFPGVAAEDGGAEIKITIPARLRLGHEAHFAEVASRFFGYLRNRTSLPTWERPNMLAKYYVTTTGTELSRLQPPRVAPKRAPR
jgi:hypothetical protein